jgi:hypothetical protein
MLETQMLTAVQATLAAALPVGTGLYLELAPQDAPVPMVIYQVISVTPTTSVCGSEESGDSRLLQVTSYAHDADAARHLLSTCRIALAALATPSFSFQASRSGQYELDARLYRCIGDFLQPPHP